MKPYVALGTLGPEDPVILTSPNKNSVSIQPKRNIFDNGKNAYVLLNSKENIEYLGILIEQNLHRSY